MSIHPTSKDPGEAFRKAWGEGEKDLSKVTKEERDKRNEGSREITDAYYDLANDNLEQGWNRKFHFCRFQHGESIDAALSRHEHFMALMTNMKPGFKVLDVGCGNGAPARTIASFIGGHVTGITINKPQIERANRYSKEEGLSECVEFVEGDFTVCVSALSSL
jgi:sterol 24-C-methyltransferase